MATFDPPIDPPKEEVPEAIAQCHQAGIKITLVTGDYGLTAEAIARQIGLVSEPVRGVTGRVLNLWSKVTRVLGCGV